MGFNSSFKGYTTSCNTQSSAPEDGQNHRPKHVELIGIINKPLLLHLVGCLILLYQSMPGQTHIKFDSLCIRQYFSDFNKKILSGIVIADD